MEYYNTLDSLAGRYHAASRKLAYGAKSLSEHLNWKNDLRAALRKISGIERIKGCDLTPKTVETKQSDGYRREKVVIQTEPHVWMPFYILIPGDLRPTEKRAYVIVPHGHGSAGKEAVVGNGDVPGVSNALARYRYDYALPLVRAGFVVFAPDARGFGERREYWMQGGEEERILGSCCSHLNNIAISLGYSLTGFWTWDLMRLIDYIEELPYADSWKIGCCGFSGGGLQTLWLAALDERVRCAVISGYFYGFMEALLMEPHCSCNYTPRLWEYADAGDMAALIAPRPLLIETGENDRLNGRRGMPNVIEQIEITKTAYRLLEKETFFWHHVHEGDHCWNGLKTVEFLNQGLK